MSSQAKAVSVSRGHIAHTGRKLRIGVIGAGRVGSAIAFHGKRLGYRIAGVYDKRPTQAWIVYGLLKLPYVRMRSRDVAAESNVLFFTTPDAHIESEFRAVRKWVLPGTLVVHCSGTLGTEVFVGAREQGLETLALHPIQSFSSHAQAIKGICGCHFALEGTRAGLLFGRRFVARLGGTSLVVKYPQRPLYHAMCVFMSNFLTALFGAAETIGGRLGMPRGKVARMMLPLAKTVLQNAVEYGAVASLTGPVQRGDADTVRRQLDALQQAVPQLALCYRVISEYLVTLARRQGLSSGAASRVLQALREKTGCYCHGCERRSR